MNPGGTSAPRVAVVGGGLAGLAAAAVLAERGLQVELFEARRQLAGRAGSFRDPATGELVDHCQHVSMGCCTNLADFCRRTGVADCFRHDDRLHFFALDGRRYDLAASRWLPAPLHLAPSFLRLGYLTLGERIGVARALWQLARMQVRDDVTGPTVGAWLVEQAQSAAAIERFWAPVLVSALGESLERASLAYARKVFVDGFMVSRDGYRIEVPRVPLGELYGERLAGWLTSHGVRLHLETPIAEIRGSTAGVTHIVLGSGASEPVDAVVVAVPWRRVSELFTAGPLRDALLCLATVDKIEAAPITGVHLWFDREITPLPHAVLVGMTSQWVFNHGASADANASDSPRHYYQVVISASYNLAGQDREQLVQEIVAELGRVWPAARSARLLHSRMVTEQAAVFSVSPGTDRYRPAQQTPIGNLALAGDWTATDWPATMEGAVRSGYLAAEAILAHCGRPERIVVPDLARSFLARMLFR